MSIKINLGINKKIGMPDYGSRGASCNVEFELDGSFDNGGAERIQEATRKAYGACRQAVEAELGCAEGGLTNRIGGQHSSPVPHNGNGQSERHAGPNIRMATSSQVRAIHAIGNRNRVDLPALMSSQFDVSRPEDLSILDASTLIDQLKGTNTGSDTAVSR